MSTQLQQSLDGGLCSLLFSGMSGIEGLGLERLEWTGNDLLLFRMGWMAGCGGGWRRR